MVVVTVGLIVIVAERVVVILFVVDAVRVDFLGVTVAVAVRSGTLRYELHHSVADLLMEEKQGPILSLVNPRYRYEVFLCVRCGFPTVL